MFSDPNKPFAAVPPTGPESKPQPPPPLGAPSGKVPPPLPEVWFDQDGSGKPVQAPASPFSLIQKVPEPRIAGPSEGFAAEGSGPPKPEPIPAAIPRPQGQPRHSAPDSFGIPIPGGLAGEFVLPAGPFIHAEIPSLKENPAGQASAIAKTTDPVRSSRPVAPGDMPQLVLRAIFGVTDVLSREEILERARGLPGVRNLQIIGSGEVRAMSTIRSGIEGLGFGNYHSMRLHTDGGIVHLIEEPGITLAVLCEGAYQAGVRETLIIVARELAGL